jgi:putative PEP-CTERM system TPR-repeat lipoprotein
LQPTYVPAAVRLAQWDLVVNDPLSARKRLENVLRVDPRNAHAMLALAEIGSAIKASRAEIMGWLTDAHKLKPNSAAIAVPLAKMYIESGKAAEALEVARILQRSRPTHTGALEVLGSAQIMTGDAVGALGTFVQLAALEPNSPEVLFRLGQLQARTGSDATATLTLHKVLELAPAHTGAMLALGELFIRSGRTDDVLALAQRLQAKAETGAQGFALAGDAHAARGDLQAATKAYERAVELASDASPLVRLHGVLAQLGRAREGDERLKRWIAQHPADTDARVHWADTLLERKDYANAIAEYLVASAHMPDDARLHNNLAWAMFQVRDRRARHHADRALALKPNDPAVLGTVGWILVNQNEVWRGIELLQLAASRAPDKLDVRVHLAHAWLKAGDRGKARSEVERAMRSNPPPERAAELDHLLKLTL